MAHRSRHQPAAHVRRSVAPVPALPQVGRITQQVTPPAAAHWPSFPGRPHENTARTPAAPAAIRWKNPATARHRRHRPRSSPAVYSLPGTRPAAPHSHSASNPPRPAAAPPRIWPGSAPARRKDPPRADGAVGRDLPAAAPAGHLQAAPRPWKQHQDQRRRMTAAPHPPGSATGRPPPRPHPDYAVRGTGCASRAIRRSWFRSRRGPCPSGR
jgi:hypothetical protein